MATEELKPGALLDNGRYRVLRRLGGGGQATVYAVVDTTSPYKAKYAVKKVLFDDEGFLARLEREADILADLDHQGIVPFVRTFEERGELHLVMKYISGSNLRDAMKDPAGDYTVEEKVQILISVLKALNYLSTRNPPVVQRDIKPSNILIDTNRDVWLADFGIARATGDPHMTGAGLPVGSRPFMAPELHDQEEATTASDIWAVGVVGWWLFGGALRSDPKALMQELEPAGDFAGEYTSAIRQALSWDPAQRPAPAEMKQALEYARGVGSPTVPIHLPAFADTKTQYPTPVAAPTRPQDALMAEDAAKKPKRRPWTLIGVGVALLAVVVSTSLITQALTGGASASDADSLQAATSQTTEIAAAEVVPAETVYVTVTPSATATEAPSASSTSSTSAPSRFEIVFGGNNVGPELYQLNRGETFFSTGWTGVTTDGIEVSKYGCQILVSFSGPEFVESERTNQCSVRESWMSRKIAAAGEYTMTVTDEVTGVSSSRTFTVID